jgi:hypothetical protein
MPAKQRTNLGDVRHYMGGPAIIPAWRQQSFVRDLGGSARSDALSTIDVMPKVLAFLERSLQ